MRKTMYLAMDHLAKYIATHDGDFATIWETWKCEYEPTSDMVPYLTKMAKRLCLADKQEIKTVPEANYRSIVTRIVREHQARQRVQALIEEEEKHGRKV